jgi:hypothetical protein
MTDCVSIGALMQPFLASDFSNLGAFIVCLPALVCVVLLTAFGCIFRIRSLHATAAVIAMFSGFVLLHSISYARGDDKLLAKQVGIAALVMAGAAISLAVFSRPRRPVNSSQKECGETRDA